jgi:hypothetical protein
MSSLPATLETAVANKVTALALTPAAARPATKGRSSAWNWGFRAWTLNN